MHTTVYKVHPLSSGPRILIACGPGNNGGDGLVAARHLSHYGYKPSIYYPKRSKNDLYTRLCTQLSSLQIPFVEDFDAALRETDHIVDAIFGFSFSGPLREPFPSVIKALENTSIPVTSVDAPSSWDIEDGPPKNPDEPGHDFMPQTLISLTAPKPCVKWFAGPGRRHFIGGRFLTKEVCEKYGLDLPEYEGIDQIVEVEVGESGETGGGKL